MVAWIRLSGACVAAETLGLLVASRVLPSFVQGNPPSQGHECIDRDVDVVQLLRTAGIEVSCFHVRCRHRVVKRHTVLLQEGSSGPLDKGTVTDLAFDVLNCATDAHCKLVIDDDTGED